MIIARSDERLSFVVAISSKPYRKYLSNPAELTSLPLDSPGVVRANPKLKVMSCKEEGGENSFSPANNSDNCLLSQRRPTRLWASVNTYRNAARAEANFHHKVM